MSTPAEAFRALVEDLRADWMYEWLAKELDPYVTYLEELEPVDQHPMGGSWQE